VVATIDKDGKVRRRSSSTRDLGGRHRRQCREPGLEALGVKVDRTHVVTDEYCRRPASPGLYAIGDVAGPPWLAHKASHEGVICVELIAGLNPHPIKQTIPGCTYCHPQVASVGLTEAKAKAAGQGDRQGRPFPLHRQRQGDRARRTRGLVKTVFDAKTGELLGAHMIGAEVTELIQGYVIGHDAGDHRGRPDAHRLPAPDAERDDARAPCSTPGAPS
jgi:dihydrolipoamide dehydrogenase